MAVVVATGATPAAGRPAPTALDATSPRVIGGRADCSARTECTVSWELARPPVKVYAGATPDRIDHRAPAAVVRTGTEATVANPDPGAPRYFEVVARGSRHGPVVGDRVLHLEGAPNTRDLGGYQTVDGKRTRWGRLFRTDALAAATATDRTRLTTLGLPTECASAPAPEGAWDADAAIAAAATVTSRASRIRDRAFLRRLARDPVPQWVQCSLVEDRVDWPAALALATLGVGKETIVADQLLTNQLPTNQPSGPAPADRRTIDAAFDAIDARYRTFGRYLVKGLGLDERTYLRLRARYVADP